MAETRPFVQVSDRELDGGVVAVRGVYIHRVGYELHLVVQARDVKWTNYMDRTNLGPEVPAVITTCNLVSAGSH